MTNRDAKEGGLTDRQLKALPYIVTAATYKEGCRVARISKNTFFRWLKEDSAFREELQRQRDAIVEEALDAMKGHVADAVDVLVTLMKNTKNEFLRRSVANDVIGHVLKWKEVIDLERRIAALEEQFEKERKTE